MALIPSAQAAVGLSVSPANITNDYVGRVTLSMTGLSAGETVRETGNIGNGVGSVINQGTISADASGGTITLDAHPFINQGNMTVAAGTLLNVNSSLGSS